MILPLPLRGKPEPRLRIVAAWVSDATQVLVISQVVLSFVLPVPLITLVLFSGSRTIMGTLANSPVVNALAIGGSVIVLSINVLLLLSLLLPA